MAEGQAWRWEVDNNESCLYDYKKTKPRAEAIILLSYHSISTLGVWIWRKHARECIDLSYSNFWTDFLICSICLAGCHLQCPKINAPISGRQILSKSSLDIL